MDDSELDEATMVDDVLVAEEFELGPDDVPPTDDEESVLGDADDDGDEDLDEPMDEGPSETAATEPVEDQSTVQLREHTAAVYAVAVNSASPTQFATGGGDDVALLWQADSAAPRCRLAGHSDTVSSLAFSSDGTLLATAGLDGTVRVWSTATGELVVVLEGPTQGINWVCWHARGMVLLAGSEDATAWMWKLPEGSVMQIFSAHSASVSYGGFVNQGRSVLTGSEDGTVRVWNPRAGTVEHTIHAGSPHEPLAVTCLQAHPAQPTFLFGAEDGRVKLGHAESGKVLFLMSDCILMYSCIYDDDLRCSHN